jgi:hypothetical protein
MINGELSRPIGDVEEFGGNIAFPESLYAQTNRSDQASKILEEILTVIPSLSSIDLKVPVVPLWRRHADSWGDLEVDFGWT